MIVTIIQNIIKVAVAITNPVPQEVVVTPQVDNVVIRISVTQTGGSGVPNLQQVTDVGNTTTNDLEITDENKGLILATSGGRRARITLTDDGFGNLQLTITEL